MRLPSTRFAVAAQNRSTPLDWLAEIRFPPRGRSRRSGCRWRRRRGRHRPGHSPAARPRSRWCRSGCLPRRYSDRVRVDVPRIATPLTRLAEIRFRARRRAADRVGDRRIELTRPGRCPRPASRRVGADSVAQNPFPSAASGEEYPRETVAGDQVPGGASVPPIVFPGESDDGHAVLDGFLRDRPAGPCR